jgi:hypothetical protein
MSNRRESSREHSDDAEYDRDHEDAGSGERAALTKVKTVPAAGDVLAAAGVDANARTLPTDRATDTSLAQVHAQRAETEGFAEVESHHFT